jgi:hypothetical protein
MRSVGNGRILYGVGRWIQDEVLGNALHVPLEEDAGTALVLPEGTWTGTVAPDTTYGCDVCIVLQ